MTNTPYTLARLGWGADFQRQLDLDEIGTLTPARVSAVHRDRVAALAETGPMSLTLPADTPSALIAVGDWVLADPAANRIDRLLDRKSVLHRRAAGDAARDQLIAANVDTLFITTSANADFNPARLERYLALAHAGGVQPVFVLTKADLADDLDPYRDALREIARDVPVLAVDARDASAAGAIADWCGPRQTAAFVGSSGVGKSTLIATLTGQALATAGIREDDAKGRHTTTHRALFAMEGGGWVIDTPGMRALRLTDAAEGIDATFADLADLAQECRFRDCAHETEPGCAVQAAIAAGTLAPDRLRRWKKLRAEDARNAETLAQARARDKAFGKMVRSVVKAKDSRT